MRRRPTHPALAELLGDLVVRDGLADHAGPILARFRYVAGTTDPSIRHIFSPRGLPPRRFAILLMVSRPARTSGTSCDRDIPIGIVQEDPKSLVVCNLVLLAVAELGEPVLDHVD